MDRFVTVSPRARVSTTTFSETAGKSADEANVTPAAAAATTGKRKREKSQKYSEAYLKFGFTIKETEGGELLVLN